MKTSYLLPCTCGRRIPVERTQAGQLVQCVCGASLEIPTLRGMASLERLDSEPTGLPRRSSWGLRQGMIFLGGVMLAGALVLAVVLYLARPTPPSSLVDGSQIRKQTESLTLLQSLQLWEGLIRGFDQNRSEDELRYAQAVEARHRWLGVALTVGGLGLVLMGGSLLVPYWRRR